MIDLRFQPMTERPKNPGKPGAHGRRCYQRSPFQRSVGPGYEDLERELAFLKATDIVVEGGFDRLQIRNDGWPRSSANPSHPDIRLFFKCKHGTLRYECAVFEDWQANLRAIGLWMQRQRLALEEWGIGSGGEAYRGFAALPGAIQASEWASAEDAIGWLAELVVLPSGTPFRKLYIEAAKVAHPDAGGSAELMAKVNRAKEFIEKHGGAA